MIFYFAVNAPKREENNQKSHNYIEKCGRDHTFLCFLVKRRRNAALPAGARKAASLLPAGRAGNGARPDGHSFWPFLRREVFVGLSTTVTSPTAAEKIGSKPVTGFEPISLRAGDESPAVVKDRLRRRRNRLSDRPRRASRTPRRRRRNTAETPERHRRTRRRRSRRRCRVRRGYSPPGRLPGRPR